jgi:methyl-accepting chemotaxis protein
MRMSVTSELTRRLVFYGLADDGVQASLRRVGELVGDVIPAVVDRFIDHAATLPGVGPRIAANRQVLKPALVEHYETLLAAGFGPAYVASTERVVRIERDSGLDVRVRNTAAQFMTAEGLAIFGRRHRFSGARVAALADALTRAFTFDIAFGTVHQLNAEAEETRLRAEHLSVAIDAFERNAGAVMATVSRASDGLSNSASTVSGRAREASALTGELGRSTEDVKARMDAASEAVDALGRSIREISDGAARSRGIVQSAVEGTGRTSRSITELAEAVGQIGSVVELISRIAGQTNLLALNATIEAARAGDAGRGFAVVAQEVKGLANQTAAATDQIARQIETLRLAASRSVEDMTVIEETIRGLSAISAAAGDELNAQERATAEIAEAVADMEGATRGFIGAFGRVEEAMRETNGQAGQLAEWSAALAGAVADLRAEIGGLSERVRAA